MDETQFVNIDQASAIAGVTRRTIYHWLEKGRLVTRRTAGGSLRIQVRSLFRETAPSGVPLGPADAPIGGVGHAVAASSSGRSA